MVKKNDGCIDFFYGTNPACNFYHIWNELIDMKQLEIFHYQEYRRVEDKNGQFIRIRTNVNCLFFPGNYKYWVDLRENNRGKYKQEKNRIADEVIDILEKRFGNVKAHVEVTDVCTPATVIRYTNNWQGSMLGWWLKEEDDSMAIKNVLPGLEDFYMAGQWVDGGGVSTAIYSGKNAAQIICKKDKKKFTTSHY
jgi:phytoene dehydrogenase-like protein